MKYKIVRYKNINGNCPIDNFVKLIMKQHKCNEILQINHSIKLLEEFGNNLIKEYPKLVKHIKDGIYELRPGRNRILYFFYDDLEQCYVLLHGFIKSTQKTPKKEIDRAISEKNDYERNANYEERKPFQLIW